MSHAALSYVGGFLSRLCMHHLHSPQQVCHHATLVLSHALPHLPVVVRSCCSYPKQDPDQEEVLFNLEGSLLTAHTGEREGGTLRLGGAVMLACQCAWCCLVSRLYTVNRHQVALSTLQGAAM
jgi:hypothetical protein